MTTQRLTAAAALHLGIPMTESIDQKAARLIALKAEAYYLQGRGKVEHALLAHAEFESALRTELAPAVQGEPVAWRQTGKYISDWRDFSETKDSHDFWLANENKEIEFAYTTPQTLP